MLYYPGMEFELPEEDSNTGYFDQKYGKSLLEEVTATLLQVIAIEKARSDDASNQD